MEDLADILDADFSQKIKKIDNKIVYIAKLDCEDPSVEMAQVITDEIFGLVDSILEDEGIVFVLYYGDFDNENMYRICDESKIDVDKLD